MPLALVVNRTKTPHTVLHWQIGRGNNPRWAVREGDWKLIGNPNDTSKKAALTAKDKLFLVNLRESVSEMKNLAETNPDIVQRLKKLHDDWASKNSQ